MPRAIDIEPPEFSGSRQRDTRRRLSAAYLRERDRRGAVLDEQCGDVRVGEFGALLLRPVRRREIRGQVLRCVVRPERVRERACSERSHPRRVARLSPPDDQPIARHRGKLEI
jgi:hypothetical protein